MKLTTGKILLVSFILFLSCSLYGCQSGHGTSGQPANVTDDKDSSSSDKKSVKVMGQENKVTSISVGDKSAQQYYMLYVMKDGEVECSRQIQKDVDAEGNLSDMYQQLLEELIEYIGYQVDLNSMQLKKNQIYIDLGSDSAIFHKEQYNALIENPVRYTDYDEMAFGILDSICMTIQKNNEQEIEVFFTQDGDVLQLPEVSTPTEFSKEKAYQGSEYYKELYLSRAEGSITDFVDLGMSYNDVLVCLNQREIPIQQTEDFSMLGDHTGWETYDSVDEYLRNAWLHIQLDADSYTFLFDGMDTTLKEIKVTGKNLPSPRGLFVGDSLSRLQELYGDSFTMYVSDGGLLYEYQLEDCYFIALVDAVQEYVLSYGTSSYSQAEVIRGQKIVEAIEIKQEQQNEQNMEQNSEPDNQPENGQTEQ